MTRNWEKRSSKSQLNSVECSSDVVKETNGELGHLLDRFNVTCMLPVAMISNAESTLDYVYNKLLMDKILKMLITSWSSKSLRSRGTLSSISSIPS